MEAGGSGEACAEPALDDGAGPSVEPHNAAAAEAVRQALKRYIAKVGSRVVYLFHKWDANEDGGIDKQEFRAVADQLLNANGRAFAEHEVDAFFEMADADRNGKIEFNELNKVLRKGARGSVQLDNKLKTGALGEIVTKSENKTHPRSVDSVRHGQKVISGAYRFDNKSRKGLLEQLSDLMHTNGMRTRDIFRDWDVDLSGTLDSGEFRDGVLGMGFEGGDTAIGKAFEEMDADGCGEVDPRMFEKVLHKYIGLEHYKDHSLTHGAVKQAPRQGRRASLWDRVSSAAPQRKKAKDKDKDKSTGEARAKGRPERPETFTMQQARQAKNKNEGPLSEKLSEGDRRRRRSSLLTPWRRKSAKMSEGDRPTSLFDPVANAEDALAELRLEAEEEESLRPRRSRVSFISKFGGQPRRPSTSWPEEEGDAEGEDAGAQALLDVEADPATPTLGAPLNVLSSGDPRGFFATKADATAYLERNGYTLWEDKATGALAGYNGSGEHVGKWSDGTEAAELPAAVIVAYIMSNDPGW